MCLLLLIVNSKIIKKDQRLDLIRLEEEDITKMFSMEDWEKTMIKKVKMRWGNRRREIEEIERR